MVITFGVFTAHLSANYPSNIRTAVHDIIVKQVLTVGGIWNLDIQFGTVRGPYKIDHWETNREPLSKCVLNQNVGHNLISYKKSSEVPLLRHAAKTITYIWVMDPGGEVHISVEELAEMPDGTEIAGYPRRRDFPRHPSEEKKLGHPCLIQGKGARVGGELFLDEKSGILCWFVNVNSGRY